MATSAAELESCYGLVADACAPEDPASCASVFQCLEGPGSVRERRDDRVRLRR
ncbi:MAG: hypothetical protein R3F60_32335 [bacterium]